MSLIVFCVMTRSNVCRSASLTDLMNASYRKFFTVPKSQSPLIMHHADTVPHSLKAWCLAWVGGGGWASVKCWQWQQQTYCCHTGYSQSQVIIQSQIDTQPAQFSSISPHSVRPRLLSEIVIDNLHWLRPPAPRNNSISLLPTNCVPRLRSLYT